jgi:hypothetical protein
MSIHVALAEALGAVLENSWSTELPPDPTWPALVFNVRSEPEKGWVLGGGYDQNMVEVIIFARTRSEIGTLKNQVREAVEAMDGYMGDEEHGDAAYEPDPQLYAYMMNFIIRTRQES